MLKQMKHVVMSGIITLFVGLVGCQQANQIRCQYQSGQSERITVAQEKNYESWVEMPEKEPTQRNSRKNRQELTLLRHVDSVASDGSALMTITIEKAEVALDIDTQKSKSKHHYTSTAENTNTTWGNEPAVAGVSYQIKIAPDTRVLEIIGLDEARTGLNIKKDAKGIASNILSEEAIRVIHERSFVKDSPGPEALAPIPDAMIKAKAIRKTYNYQQDAEHITALSVGEAAYTAPEGFPEPPTPSNMGQTMIINISEMDKLIVQGRGVFDLNTGSVTSEENNIKCTLVIDESNLSAQFGKEDKKGSGGVMFTVTEIKNTFDASVISSD